jgi:hypothetical protein
MKKPEFLSGFAAVMLLSACAEIQPIDPMGYVAPERLTQHIDCELWRAVDENPQFKGWWVKYDLSLQVDALAGATPGASIIQVDRHVGLANAGTINWGFGGSLSGTATRIETITIKEKIPESDTACESELQQPRPGIAGNLGIADGMREMAAVANQRYPAGDTDPPQNPKSRTRKSGSALQTFGHTAQFILVAGANMTPTISLVRFKGPAPSGTLAGVTRTDTDKLVMSFAPLSTTLKITAFGLTTQIPTDADFDRTLLLQQLQLIAPNLTPH